MAYVFRLFADQQICAARFFFEFLLAYGLLQKDVLIEANGLDLKADHVGGTAPKVQSLVRSAKGAFTFAPLLAQSWCVAGGLLFVDEAYALADTGQQGRSVDRFAIEAVRTLLTETESCRTDTVVVLAGYPDKMKTLMRADDGMARRFPKAIHLDNYSAIELAQIVERRAHKEYALAFECPELLGKLEKHIEEQHSIRMATENASLAVHLLEDALDRRSTRKNKAQREGAECCAAGLLPEDFGIFDTPPETLAEEKAALEKEIEELVGMAKAKVFFDSIRAKVLHCH